ncbi:MAG: crossover junction endodeoxyribonuclease RuvC [bacterium]|nr:crossover junction endodeoxyribonuclease RuvC [bacterium]
MAVDPGFDRLGIAVLKHEEGKEILIHSACIQTNVKNSKSERLLVIGLGVEEAIKRFKPGSLAIESLFFNSNTTSALGVAEARGVAILKAAEAGLPVYEYSPQAIKIACTGYGRASKLQVALMVKKLVALPRVPHKRLDDELDAIALGITHLASKRGI